MAKQEVKQKYVNQTTFKAEYYKPKKSEIKSKTVPGQSYTTKQILEMSKRGIAPSILKEAIYEMDMFGEDLNPLRKPGFDLSDMDKVTETVKRFRDKIEATRKKQALIDKEKEREKIIQDYLQNADKNKDGILDPGQPEQ